MSEVDKVSLGPPAVLASLKAVMDAIPAIGKGLTVTMGARSYQARGIDAVVNVLHQLFKENSLVIRSKTTSAKYEFCEIGQNKTRNCHAQVLISFYAVSTIDGSTVVLGEDVPAHAMDTGDKSMAKALSQALKYCLGQAFLIPFADWEDQDKTRPEEDGNKELTAWDRYRPMLEDLYREAGMPFDKAKVLTWLGASAEADVKSGKCEKLVAMLREKAAAKEAK